MIKKTHDEFIEELKIKNNNFKKGNYEIIGLYENAHTKIKIKDKFGFYYIPPNDLLRGNSNPSIKNAINKYENITNRFKSIHNQKYTYKKFSYVNYEQKIEIECKEHGSFFQKIGSHILGNGCPKCAKNILTFEEVVEKANKIHKNKYKYPLQKYINQKMLLKITCPIHGEFNQVSEYHLSGCGCQLCAIDSLKNRIGGYSKNYMERNKTKFIDIPCVIYLVNLFSSEENFFKIGITTAANLKNRFKNFKVYEYKKNYIYNTNLYEAFYKEQRILKYFKFLKYIPKKVFGGKTECFTDNVSLFIEFKEIIYSKKHKNEQTKKD